MAYYLHSGKAILAIPKCGSESLACGTRLADDEAARLDRIAFIRGPFSRCVSGWSFFRGQPQSSLHLAKWEDWVDRVLSGEDNEHWRPQASFITDERVLPFEQFGMFVRFHEHRSMWAAFDPGYRLEELRQYYKDDFALRGQYGPRI